MKEKWISMKYHTPMIVSLVFPVSKFWQNILLLENAQLVCPKVRKAFWQNSESLILKSYLFLHISETQQKLSFAVSTVSY